MTPEADRSRNLPNSREDLHVCAPDKMLLPPRCDRLCAIVDLP